MSTQTMVTVTMPEATWGAIYALLLNVMNDEATQEHRDLVAESMRLMVPVLASAAGHPDRAVALEESIRTVVGVPYDEEAVAAAAHCVRRE